MASGTAMHTKAHRPPAPPPMPPCRHRPPSCLLPGKAPQATQLNRASQFCSRVSTQTPMVASKLKSRSSRPLYYRRAGQDLRARTAEAWTTISPRISDVSAFFFLVSASVGRDMRSLVLSFFIRCLCCATVTSVIAAFIRCSSVRTTPHVAPYLYSI